MSLASAWEDRAAERIARARRSSDEAHIPALAKAATDRRHGLPLEFRKI
jgi:hypothetical protein